MCISAKGSLPGLELIHPLADSEQITVQLTVVERPQFYLNHLSAPQQTTWQLKKGEQALPGSMSIGGRKKAVPDPHGQVCKRHFADGHDLILAVIQFMHHALTCR